MPNNGRVLPGASLQCLEAKRLRISRAALALCAMQARTAFTPGTCRASRPPDATRLATLRAVAAMHASKPGSCCCLDRHGSSHCKQTHIDWMLARCLHTQSTVSKKVKLSPLLLSESPETAHKLLLLQKQCILLNCKHLNARVSHRADGSLGDARSNAPEAGYLQAQKCQAERVLYCTKRPPTSVG